MRVAVAGTGSFAKHFINELPAAGHEVVVLTRSHKNFLDGKTGVIEQRATNYSSAQQLAELLNDCDALVSTIADMANPCVETHLKLLEACKQTPKCKRFIPAEYGVNSEDFPNAGMERYNVPLKEALREQREVEWTFISLGWLLDYIVPSANRYHADLPYPLDLEARVMKIPGTGNDVFSMTSARDTTKAVAELLKSQNKWRPYTYVQGMETTWLQLAETMKTIGGMPDLKVSFEPVNNEVQVCNKEESAYSAFLAELALVVPSGRCTFDQAKVHRDRVNHFPNVHFRGAQELLEAVKQDSGVIV